MSKIPDVQLCPECGCYQRRGMLCMKCESLTAMAARTKVLPGVPGDKLRLEKTPGVIMRGWGAPLGDLLTSCPAEVQDIPFIMGGPRHGDRFDSALDGKEQPPFVGFNSAPLADDVITVPTSTIDGWKGRIEELRREVEAHGLKMSAVIFHPAGQGAKEPGLAVGDPINLMEKRIAKRTHPSDELVGVAPLPREIKEWVPPSADIVMSAIEDPASMLNQGLVDALDARELDVVEVRPVLFRVPERVGKGAQSACLRICAKNPHDDDLVIELTASGRDAPFLVWAIEVESRAKRDSKVEGKLAGMRLSLRSWYNLYMADFSPKEAIEQLISEEK